MPLMDYPAYPSEGEHAVPPDDRRVSDPQGSRYHYRRAVGCFRSVFLTVNPIKAPRSVSPRKILISVVPQSSGRPNRQVRAEIDRPLFLAPEHSVLSLTAESDFVQPPHFQW